MKHKLLQSLMLIAALLTCTHAYAHDFEAQNSDGVTIYYNITSSTNKTCEVTFQGSSYDSYSNEYTGSIVIPETVTYNGTTYSVTSIGWYAFDGCSSLTAIKVGTGNSKYDSRNNCNAIIETSTNTLIAGCKNTIIPNSVTSIG